MPAPTELQISGLNPIASVTSACQFAVDDATDVTYKVTISQLTSYLGSSFLQKSNNLSDVASVPTAVANLGLTIGTDTQAYSAQLTSFAAASIVDNAVLVTGVSGALSFSTTLPTGMTVPGYLPLSGGTLSGSLNMGNNTLTGLTTPVNATDACTKQYADNIAAGLNPIQGAYGASTANLTGWTYNNGSSGVGATLTAPSNGIFTQDGVSPPVDTRWLYKDDTTGGGAYNGIYNVTTSTSGAPAVLTRTTDYDTAAEISQGDLISVQNGTVNAGSSWYQTAVVTTMGTSPIQFSQFFSPANYVSSTLTSGTIYIGNGSNKATQSSSTWPSSTTINQLLFSSANNTVTGLTTANNGVLITSSGGVPSISSTLPSGLTIPNLKTNAIFDSTYGLGVINISSTASAVNYLNATGSITGNPVTFGAAGSDINITLNFSSKGTGNINFLADGNALFGLNGTVTNPVNSLSASPAATGNAPILQAVGSDTNISFLLAGKGNLGANIQGSTNGVSAIAGYTGETVKSNIVLASAVNLSNNTAANITSISLSAGNWNIFGNAIISQSVGTTDQSYIWASTTSATLPDLSLTTALHNTAANTYTGGSIPFLTVNTSSPITVYLSVYSGVSSGTKKAAGNIYAERAP
ncbi:MAG: hypothetical protein KGJ07_00255 [Patescibacteria group bacterium]|nr:hypothetical protein [Patescibacteria group bacterium]